MGNWRSGKLRIIAQRHTSNKCSNWKKTQEDCGNYYGIKYIPQFIYSPINEYLAYIYAKTREQIIDNNILIVVISGRIL